MNEVVQKLRPLRRHPLSCSVYLEIPSSCGPIGTRSDAGEERSIAFSGGAVAIPAGDLLQKSQIPLPRHASSRGPRTLKPGFRLKKPCRNDALKDFARAIHVPTGHPETMKRTEPNGKLATRNSQLFETGSQNSFLLLHLDGRGWEGVLFTVFSPSPKPSHQERRVLR